MQLHPLFYGGVGLPPALQKQIDDTLPIQTIKISTDCFSDVFPMEVETAPVLLVRDEGKVFVGAVAVAFLSLQLSR